MSSQVDSLENPSISCCSSCLQAIPPIALKVMRIAGLVLFAVGIAGGTTAYFYLHHLPFTFVGGGAAFAGIALFILGKCLVRKMTEQEARQKLHTSNDHLGNNALKALQKLDGCRFQHVLIGELHRSNACCIFNSYDGDFRHFYSQEFHTAPEGSIAIIYFTKDEEASRMWSNQEKLAEMKTLQPELIEFVEKKHKIIFSTFKEFQTFQLKSQFPPRIARFLST